ncbi:MAG: hypothetical protein L0Z50_38590 [Verrucomicrobiales bacterium]|nr:hypothetical protein [Verrucomicrobiales bacterium]
MRDNILDKLYDVLMDFEYLQARISLSFAIISHQHASTIGNLPITQRYIRAVHLAEQLSVDELYVHGNDVDLIIRQKEVFDLLCDFQRALAVLPIDHPMREQVIALYHAIHENWHVPLKKDPRLLVQQTCNALVRYWDETTELGRRARKAIAHPRLVEGNWR